VHLRQKMLCEDCRGSKTKIQNSSSYHVVDVPVADNAVSLDLLPADSVLADVVPAIPSWTSQNISVHHAMEPEDRAVGDRVRQQLTRDLEGQFRNNAGSKRSDKAPYKGWREYIAASGRLYYHHKPTNTTQWKKPF